MGLRDRLAEVLGMAMDGLNEDVAENILVAEVRLRSHLLAALRDKIHDFVDPEPDGRDKLQHIVEVVQAEYVRRAAFGMTPAPEDYRTAIEQWLTDGRKPSRT